MFNENVLFLLLLCPIAFVILTQLTHVSQYASIYA